MPASPSRAAPSCGREEPRIAEQQFGNLHHLDAIRNSKVERKLYGRFFYRFR